MFNLALPELMPTLAQAGNTARGWLMPEGDGSHVQYVDWAMDAINFVTVFFFVGIIAAMLIFVLKFRRTSPHERAKSQMGHNTALELSWTLPPVVIVIFIFYLGFTGYMKLSTMPADAYEVQVTGQKWSWSFTHPSGRVDTDVLHVPAGANVRLVATSRDVIHSVFIPAYRIKKDAVPGRYNRLWFRPETETPGADAELPADSAAIRRLAGEHLAVAVGNELKASPKAGVTVEQEVESRLAAADEKKLRDWAQARLEAIARDNGHILYCTEFCGTNHSLMLARVVVHKKGWVAPPEQIDFGNPIAAGEKLFKSRGCAGCHMIPGGPATAIGPSFANGVFGKTEQTSAGPVKVEENYLRESIVNPSAKIVQGFGAGVMPVIPMSEQEIDALIQYLKSIPVK